MSDVDSSSTTRGFTLSTEDIVHFVNEGYVIVRNAFTAETATACRDVVWGHLQNEGIEKSEPDSWKQERIGLAKTFTANDGEPWSQVFTPKLIGAVETLLGGEENETFEQLGTGWWIVSFPGHSNPPAGIAGKLHVDGHWFTHHLFSKEVGLVPLFLFSNTASAGGGTCLAKRSHLDVTRWLAEAGMRGIESSGD